MLLNDKNEQAELRMNGQNKVRDIKWLEKCWKNEVQNKINLIDEDMRRESQNTAAIEQIYESVKNISTTSTYSKA